MRRVEPDILYDNKSLSKTYISPFLKQYPFLGTPSFLQVVNKDRKETYHSLF